MNSLYGEEIFHFNNDLRRNVLHNQILFPARIGNLYLRFVKIVIVNYLDQLNMTASQRIVNFNWYRPRSVREGDHRTCMR